MKRSQSVRHLQLRVLLRDLIEGNGRVQATNMLGVSNRTLARAGSLDE